jgi:hypothetical protein
MPWLFFAKLAAHSLLSLAAGWTLWSLDVWPAGDAKLYIVLSCLMPLANANLVGFPAFLFLFFLINSFVPAGVLFALEGVAGFVAAAPGAVRKASRLTWEGLKAAADRGVRRLADYWPRKWRAAALVVNLAALFFVVRLLETRTQNSPLIHLAVFLLMFGLWSRLSALMSRPQWGEGALVFFCVCALYAAFRGYDLGELLWSTVKSVVGFGMFISWARRIFSGILERSSLGRISPEELRAGTLLSDEAYRTLSLDAEAAKILGDRNCDGLAAIEAESLRGLLRSRGELSLPVYRGHPFAAWIVLGAAMTLWKPGNVVGWMAPAWAALPSLARAAWGRML